MCPDNCMPISVLSCVLLVYVRGLNNIFRSNFCEGSMGRHETSEQGFTMHRPKGFENSNKDEDNTLNILSDEKNNMAQQIY